MASPAGRDTFSVARPESSTSLIANFSGNNGLASTRNFYWYGHGEANWIGCGGGIQNCNPPINIWASAVAEALGNAPIITDGYDGTGMLSYVPSSIAVSLCFPRTAATPGGEDTWAKAFGIPHSLTWTQLDGHLNRAQAFLGWKVTTCSIGGPTLAEDYQETIGFFFELWQAGYPLEDCVSACASLGSPGPPYDPYYEENIQVGAVMGADAAYPKGVDDNGNSTLGTTKAIYGYPRITRYGAVQ